MFQAFKTRLHLSTYIREGGRGGTSSRKKLIPLLDKFLYSNTEAHML